MHLKESAYNFIYDDLGKDQIVFYNSRTGALAVVHEDQYKQYKGFQEKGKEIEDAEFLKNLLKCGYIHLAISLKIPSAKNASCCRCVWEAAPIVVWKVKQFVIN